MRGEERRSDEREGRDEKRGEEIGRTRDITHGVAQKGEKEEKRR